MRRDVSSKLEAGRVREGLYGSDASYGLVGAFEVFGPCGLLMNIVAGAADLPESEGWEHVSVSTKRRNPNWQEMCFVKDLFWDEDELVVQFHPPRKDYVDLHPYCLHLWGPPQGAVRMPPRILI